jgi:hypothetical protein
MILISAYYIILRNAYYRFTLPPLHLCLFYRSRSHDVDLCAVRLLVFSVTLFDNSFVLC